jgi:hypothetical protein
MQEKKEHACMFAHAECQHIFILRASGLSFFPSTTTIYISGREWGGDDFACLKYAFCCRYRARF